MLVDTNSPPRDGEDRLISWDPKLEALPLRIGGAEDGSENGERARPNPIVNPNLPESSIGRAGGLLKKVAQVRESWEKPHDESASGQAGDDDDGVYSTHGGKTSSKVPARPSLAAMQALAKARAAARSSGEKLPDDVSRPGSLLGAVAQKRAAISVRCQKGHLLVSYRTDAEGYSCDKCGKVVAEGAALLGCRACNFDSCLTCSGLARGKPKLDPQEEELRNMEEEMDGITGEDGWEPRHDGPPGL